MRFNTKEIKKNEMKTYRFYIMTLALTFLFAGCSEDELTKGSGAQVGDDVQFGLSLSNLDTRTVYGEETKTGFPIYWVNGDKVRVASPQCLSGRNSAEYAIAVDGEGQNYATSMTKTGDVGVQWGDEAADFYSIYPSSASTELEVSGEGVTTTLHVDATQFASTTDNGTSYYAQPAEMGNVVMYAKTAGVTSGKTVELHYTPFSTVLEFEINASNEVVAGKQKEIEKLSVDNAELNKRVVSLSRQKKQFKKVIFLTLTIIAFGVGIFYLHDNLANTRGELSSARNTIVERNATIFKNKTTIKQKENKISELNTSLQNEKAENDKLNKKISDLTSQYPIAISEIEVNSEEFSFDYDSQEEKELTFTLKAINERNGYIISNSHTLTYYADGGHKSLRSSSKLNTSDYYYVILMYDGKIIAGKRW